MKNSNGMTLEAITRAASKVYGVEMQELLNTHYSRGVPALARAMVCHLAVTCYGFGRDAVAWKLGTRPTLVDLMCSRAHAILLDSPQTVDDLEKIESEAIAIVAKRQQARQAVIQWRVETHQAEPVA